MNKILAKSKSEISLCEHTKGLLEQFDKLRTLSPELRNKLDCQLLKMAIIFHDIGKVSPSFQISIGNWGYNPRIPFPDVPHSIFSLFWLKREKIIEKLKKEEDLRILLSSIAFHHWRDNFQNIILGTDRELRRALSTLKENESVKKELLENIKSELSCDGLSEYKDLIDFDEELADLAESGKELFNYITPPYYSYFLPLRIELNEDYKKKWIFTAGVLIRVDHFASYIQEEKIKEEIDKPPPVYSDVENKIKQRIKNRIETDEDPWQIKILRDRRDKNLILVAPTGSGKTEFAYLWGASNKILFTLPLRSAVNAIFNRSCGIFGVDNVGLLHSDADVYLYEKLSNSEGERLRVLDLARQLSTPMLVSTGDQVFPSALKYPGYEKIYAVLGYSKLVIDEVQSYDPRAVAIIVKLIEDIVKLGGNFLLMTATLPEFVNEEIKERIGNQAYEYLDLYSQKEYEKIRKHKIEIRCDNIIQKIDEILNKAKGGLRVLVILNTVEKAQEVYEMLRDERDKKGSNYLNLKLIHSRFTYEDRRKLEEEIVGTDDKKGDFRNPKPEDEKEGKILVSTQVVEASLDIDADILYTELAPIDSLVQRMGRVLRRVRDQETYRKYLASEEPSEPNIYIFYQKPDKEKKLCSGAGSVYPLDLLVFSLGVLSEKINIINLDDLIREIWNEEREKKKAKKRSRKSESSNRDKLTSFLESLLTLLDDAKDKVVSLSEAEKKALVEDLYKKIPKQSVYFQRFYNTLEILDAGYMSEKKNEALRIFREIYTVPSIPENKIDEFKKSMEDFVKENCLNYTRFKMEVLSKYVVNIDIRKYLHDDSLNLKNASYLVNELNGLSEKQYSKLKTWLSDIYVFDGEYDNEIGVIFIKNRSKGKIVD